MRDRDGNIASATPKSQYTLAQPGLLTPDEKYYWHVRAMNDKGVWGPWSKTWSFTARGVAYPLDVTVDFDQAKGVGMLKWKANPAGKKPAKYRVYGSDEKGFTIADQKFQSTVGVSKEEMAAWNPWFPANFIAETTATELAVLGREVDLPAANKTYYRVVAVDEAGKRSGPSDYAAAPAAGDLQQARDGGQGRRRIPLPGQRQSVPRRPQRADERRRPDQRLLRHREARGSR